MITMFDIKSLKNQMERDKIENNNNKKNPKKNKDQ